MQTIKIIIHNGRAQSVEVKDEKKQKTLKDIEKMLQEMPKNQLAEALGISAERQALNSAT